MGIHALRPTAYATESSSHKEDGAGSLGLIINCDSTAPKSQQRESVLIAVDCSSKSLFWLTHIGGFEERAREPSALKFEMLFFFSLDLACSPCTLCQGSWFVDKS